MTDEQENAVETAEVQESDYQIVKDARIERFFDFELEVDEEDFYYDDDENLLGAVVSFVTYPDHETLTSIFDDLLIKAVQHTQDVDENEANEMVADCKDPEEYPDELDVAEDFSVFFTVEGYRGLYRVRILYSDLHVSHSSGRKNDRWEV